MIELNLSCPNVKEGGMEFSADPRMAEKMLRRVVDQTTIPVLAKLSPNVTNIGDIAMGAEAGGAAGLSLINTLVGLAVNIRERKSKITFGMGGYSGPGIKPVALAMVHKAYRAVKIPIVGIGGIATASDVVEFMIAGATCIQVGTQTFVTPTTAPSILDELPGLLSTLNVKRSADLIGTLQL